MTAGTHGQVLFEKWYFTKETSPQPITSPPVVSDCSDFLKPSPLLCMYAFRRKLNARRGRTSQGRIF
jgi:hypothetical protein